MMKNGFSLEVTLGMKSCSRRWATVAALNTLSLRIFVALQCLLPRASEAQSYDPYAYDAGIGEEQPLLERIASSSFVSLLMVFVGAAGIFLYATAAGKGERSERQRGMGIVCIIVVFIIIYYRFTIRNE